MALLRPGGNRRGVIAGLAAVAVALVGMATAAEAACPPGQVRAAGRRCVCRTTGRPPIEGACPCRSDADCAPGTGLCCDGLCRACCCPAGFDCLSGACCLAPVFLCNQSGPDLLTVETCSCGDAIGQDLESRTFTFKCDTATPCPGGKDDECPAGRVCATDAPVECGCTRPVCVLPCPLPT
jgi:hypothetical protein